VENMDGRCHATHLNNSIAFTTLSCWLALTLLRNSHFISVNIKVLNMDLAVDYPINPETIFSGYLGTLTTCVLAFEVDRAKSLSNTLRSLEARFLRAFYFG
jgi:hypothetical protein